MSKNEEVRDFESSDNTCTTANCVSIDDIFRGLTHLFKCIDRADFYAGCLTGKYSNPWKIKAGEEPTEKMKRESYAYIKKNDPKTAYFLKLIDKKDIEKLTNFDDAFLDRIQTQLKPLFNFKHSDLFSAYDRDRLLLVRACKNKKMKSRTIKKYLYSFDKRVKSQYKMSAEEFASSAYFIELDKNSQVVTDRWEKLLWSEEVKRLRKL